MTNTCVFCKIIQGTMPSRRIAEWDDAIAIVPLAPVTGDRFTPEMGHILILPRRHVEDFAENPDITALTFRRAAQLAGAHAHLCQRDFNLITSKGAAATQTVHHLHVDLVPRVDGDGLPLPWTPQQDAGLLAGMRQDAEAVRLSLLSIIDLQADPAEGDEDLRALVARDSVPGRPLSRLGRLAAERARANREV